VSSRLGSEGAAGRARGGRKGCEVQVKDLARSDVLMPLFGQVEEAGEGWRPRALQAGG
jgi:hypothetical protein